MSKKQTAINFLETKIKGMIEHGSDFGEDYPALLKHIEQAKELEKQNLIEAHNSGKSILPPNETAEDYYNNTYSNKNKQNT